MTQDGEPCPIASDAGVDYTTDAPAPAATNYSLMTLSNTGNANFNAQFTQMTNNFYVDDISTPPDYSSVTVDNTGSVTLDGETFDQMTNNLFVDGDFFGISGVINTTSGGYKSYKFDDGSYWQVLCWNTVDSEWIFIYDAADPETWTDDDNITYNPNTDRDPSFCTTFDLDGDSEYVPDADDADITYGAGTLTATVNTTTGGHKSYIHEDTGPAYRTVCYDTSVGEWVFFDLTTDPETLSDNDTLTDFASGIARDPSLFVNHDLDGDSDKVPDEDHADVSYP